MFVRPLAAINRSYSVYFLFICRQETKKAINITMKAANAIQSQINQRFKVYPT
jgi:hypothetical protein